MNNNSILKKIVMRTLFTLLIICLFVPFLVAENANGQALKENNITYNIKNASIVNVFNQLSKITGYYFFYNEEAIEGVKGISINVKNTEIGAILNELSRQTNLSFKIIDNTISVSKKGNASTSLVVTQQNGSITGVVKDKNGEPIIGVNILVEGTSLGTITDLDGKFELKNVPSGAVLKVSYIGYLAQLIELKGQNSFNIVLLEDSKTLDEVVVVGFGVQKKENLTGAVSQIKMDEVLGERPVINVMNALQGTMPGLVISGASSPGQTKNYNIRGTTSLNGGEPLVLIDNVPGNIDMINPEDIESVSVLKDAASSAIYGARAAFGVILVTTKKGKKEQRFQLSYNNNFGFQSSINRPEQASALDFLHAYKDAEFLSGNYFAGQNIDKWINYLTEYRKDPSKFETTGDGVYIPTDNNSAKIRYYLNEKDLYDNMLEDYGFLQSHNVSASGGTEKLSYRLSLGYNNERGILITDKDSYKRISASSYISADITDWLTQAVDIRYAKSTKSMPNEVSGSLYGMRLCSLTPEGDLTLDDGTTLPMNTPKNMLLYSAPSITLNENPRILSRTTIKPFKGLEAVVEYTFDKKIYDLKAYNSPYDFTSIQLGKSASASTSKYENTKSSTDYNALNAYATYSFDLNEDNHFKFMAGYNQESSMFEQLYVTRLDMINQEMPSFSSATGETTATDTYNEYTVRGGFYRFNYDYKGKYLFETNGRYDGSSKFPKNDRFGFFPSLSLGWNVAREDFMAWSSSWMNEFKLRGSWGQIGNQAINPYAYMPIMDAGKASWIVNGELPTSLATPGLVSSNFTWEKVETLDFGVDVNMLNSRLLLTYDWYQRDTKDMLAAGMELPSVVGAPAPLQNVADLRTKGWELAISWRDKIGAWGYNVGLNLYDSRTHVTKYDNAAGLLSNYYEGYEVGEIWGYVTDGFYSMDDFVDSNTWKLKEGVTSIKSYNVRPGDVKFKNLRDDEGSVNQIDPGTSTLENPGDRKIIGNTQSRYQYGITAGVNWKGFDLSILLQGTGKRDYWVSDDRRWGFNSNEFGTIFADQLDYWKPVDAANGNYNAINPNAKYFRIYDQRDNAGSNTRTQTKYLLDASYLRIKNISLSYNVPQRTVNKIGISGLKVFSSVENLHTWTSLPNGYDPERLSWGYPFYRTVSFGLNITL